jgi:hypothetical protein
MWSRRDIIAEAAKRGDLSIEEFVAFLGLMGETVVWPERHPLGSLRADMLLVCLHPVS